MERQRVLATWSKRAAGEEQDLQNFVQDGVCLEGTLAMWCDTVSEACENPAQARGASPFRWAPGWSTSMSPSALSISTRFRMQARVLQRRLACAGCILGGQRAVCTAVDAVEHCGRNIWRGAPAVSEQCQAQRTSSLALLAVYFSLADIRCARPGQCYAARRLQAPGPGSPRANTVGCSSWRLPPP